MYVPVVGKSRPARILLDAMVLAAGLTSRREPASFSRRLVELALEGRVRLVLTERLLRETYDVLVDPRFIARLGEVEASAVLMGLVASAVELIDDQAGEPPRRCADPDDDYLVEAALATGAMLVSRDDRADFQSVHGLVSGRPGAALRRLGFIDEP